jgi:hypothetical protein
MKSTPKAMRNYREEARLRNLGILWIRCFSPNTWEGFEATW